MTDEKKRHLVVPTNINFDDYQTLECDYKVNLGEKNIEPIGKSAIKIGNTRTFVSVIPTIQRFLLNMFHCRDDIYQETLKHHINRCLNIYSTYKLIDEVSTGYFYASSSNKTRKRIKCGIRIFSNHRL